MVRDSPAGDALELLSRGGGDNVRGRRRVAPDVLHDAPIPSPTRERPPTRGPAPLGAGTEGCGSDDERRSRWSSIQTLLQTLARSCEPER